MINGSINDFRKYIEPQAVISPMRDFVWRIPHIGMRIHLPNSYPKSIVITDLFLQPFCDSGFSGGALAVFEHTIWSETATAELFDRFRSLEANATICLQDQPACFFSASDYNDFYALVHLSMLGAWDAFIIDAKKDRGIALSHDGFAILYELPGKDVDQWQRRFTDIGVRVEPI